MTAVLCALTAAAILHVEWALGAALLEIEHHRTREDIARIEAGMPRDPGPWPQRQTPTAAHEPQSMHGVSWIYPTDEFEQMHRDVLAEERRRQQAQEWLEQIRVDIRDGLVSV